MSLPVSGCVPTVRGGGSSARGGPDRPFAPSEILEKVRGITGPVYLRMAETCHAVVALDDALLNMMWTDAVARMTADAPSWRRIASQPG